MNPSHVHVFGEDTTNVPWPYKDYDYIGNRYVDIQDKNEMCGEISWYERKDIHPFDTTTPTECVICIEAENEMITKYAHPKAHFEAHTEADRIAQNKTIVEKNIEDYMDYYIFHYGREYRKIYKDLLKKYKEGYYNVLLEKAYTKDDKICRHHLESIQYHGESSPTYDFD